MKQSETWYIVYDGNDEKNEVVKKIFADIIIYMEINSGLIKIDDIRGKAVIAKTMHWDFTLLLHFFSSNLLLN